VTKDIALTLWYFVTRRLRRSDPETLASLLVVRA
jgi:hypothetical protein